MVEIYEPTFIHYFMPLSDHQSYFVPEALAAPLESNETKED